MIARQRGIAVMLIVYAVAALAVFGTVAAAWYQLQHWENAAYRKVQAERDKALAALKECADHREAAKKRADYLAGLWAEQVDKTEAASRQKQEARNATFGGLVDRAKASDRRARIVLSDDTVRLWADASSAANAATPAGVGEAPAAAVPASTSEAELSVFYVEAARAYADAVAQWQSCVSFYEGLRHAESR